MRQGRATRPEGVLTAGLLVDGDLVQLVAFWNCGARFSVPKRPGFG